MNRLSKDIRTHFITIREFEGGKGKFKLVTYYVMEGDYEDAKDAADNFRQIVIPGRNSRVNHDMIHEMGKRINTSQAPRLKSEYDETPEQEAKRRATNAEHMKKIREERPHLFPPKPQPDGKK